MARTTAGKEPQLHVESLTWEDVTWVNIEGPTERETEYLAQNYPFHPLDLDDCLSRIQRPKIDEYDDYLFLVLHFPVFNKKTRVTTPSQVSVFIGQNYLITLHRGDLKPLVNLFRQCQLEEEFRHWAMSGGTGNLLYRIVDRLVDYCLPILNKIGSNIDRVDDEIFSRIMPHAIRDISELRRDVISFRRIIWPLRAVSGGLWSKVRRFTEADMEIYFDDLVDHIDKIRDGLDEYKERIEGLNDTHDSLATNRTNEIVRMLTVIATIMLPITVVASIFGMNIPLGPFGDSKLSALYVSLICLAIIAAMLYFFRRQHWI
ncbi:MAG: magnesium transporter CorA family protein [Dehalococcoidia bacterium]|nr:magnesium transporter CorA family protein [Dehalococcoidia bacterium]MBL7165598.1 magnesium transporter CorA family protein [Dehalococcoidales bacterium]